MNILGFPLIARIGRSIGNVFLILWRALRPTYVMALRASSHVQEPNYEETLHRWTEQFTRLEDSQSSQMPTVALQEQLERIRGLESKAVGGLQAAALLAAVAAFLLWGIDDNCEALWWRVGLLIPGIGIMAISAAAFSRVLLPGPRYYPFPDFGIASRADAEIATAWDMNVPIEIRVGNLVSAGIIDLARAAVFLLAGAGLMRFSC